MIDNIIDDEMLLMTKTDNEFEWNVRCVGGLGLVGLEAGDEKASAIANQNARN